MQGILFTCGTYQGRYPFAGIYDIYVNIRHADRHPEKSLNPFQRKFMKFLLYLLGALLLFGTAVLVIDNNRFVIRKYKISGRGVKKPLRIAFLTDLHENSYGRGNRALSDAVRKTDPGLILIGGDLIVSSRAEKGKGWTRNTASLLEGLKGTCPIYYVDGNHELRMKDAETRLQGRYRELEEILKGAGAISLHNRKTVLEEYGISLYGLELDRDCYRRFHLKDLTPFHIEKKIGRPDSVHFSLLLTHNPDYFKTYALWGADAVLSGHVHGGIVRIPFTRQGVINPRFRLFPRYTGGRYETDAGEGDRRHHATMVLSCGIGMHSLPVRAFNPAELSVIDIVPEN